MTYIPRELRKGSDFLLKFQIEHLIERIYLFIRSCSTVKIIALEKNVFCLLNQKLFSLKGT